jgi:hypothetical protein
MKLGEFLVVSKFATREQDFPPPEEKFKKLKKKTPKENP